jgi:glyoxylase-like metal-dependent hydrolase (beta-lactamase superfamily II)
VHEYNPNFFILRQSGCIHYEKPFLYLIFGRDKALLEDTGAGQIDTASIVTNLVAKWAKRNNKTGPVPLIVVHSHSHGDHTAGDAGFKPAQRSARDGQRAGGANLQHQDEANRHRAVDLVGSSTSFPLGS